MERGTRHSVLRVNKCSDQNGRVAALSRVGDSLKTLREMFPERFLGGEIHEGNILVNVGIQGLWKLSCSLAWPPGVWSNAKGRTGTGSGAAQATGTGGQRRNVNPGA